MLSSGRMYQRCSSIIVIMLTSRFHGVGQGLPNRIHQYQYGLRKLREHIEDLERDFTDENSKLDVDHEIADIAAMYQAVRQTAEDKSVLSYLSNPHFFPCCTQ